MSNPDRPMIPSEASGKRKASDDKTDGALRSKRPRNDVSPPTLSTAFGRRLAAERGSREQGLLPHHPLAHWHCLHLKALLVHLLTQLGYLFSVQFQPTLPAAKFLPTHQGSLRILH
jgi:hypothetical protein